MQKIASSAEIVQV